MKRQKPILHARDHMRGGADPVPMDLVSGPVADVIVATHPGAYYKMDEVSGDWADSTGNGRTLTHVSRFGTSRAQFSPLDEGDGGKAVEVLGGVPVAGMSASNVAVYGGADDYFTFTGTEQPMTVSVLINLYSIPTSFSMGVCGNADVEYAPAGDKSGWGVFILSKGFDPDPTPVARGGKVCYRRTTSSGVAEQAVTPDPIGTGGWVRITAVYGGSLSAGGHARSDLWLNNELWASTPESGPFVATVPAGAQHTRFRVGDCGIAEGFGGNMAPFDGLIDSVIVWDRALLPSEVGAIVAAGAAGLVPTTDGEGGIIFKKPTIEIEF